MPLRGAAMRRARVFASCPCASVELHGIHHDVTMKQTQGAPAKLIRTTVMLSPDMDAAMRALAEAHGRPLAWEIRRAFEAHIDREMPA